MKIVNLFIALISCLMIGASPPDPTKECINPLPDDSGSFGFSVAVNDKYMAVGDLAKNRVVIYTRDRQGKWIRIKELVPPKDSIPDKIGLGFGRNLQLDGDVLVINALTQELIRGRVKPKNFYGRYLIRLDSETEVKAIDLPIEKKQGLVQFNLLSEGEIRHITLPNNGEYELSDFTLNNFVLNRNLLLVGFPSPTGAGAWLLDLARPESKPLKLTAPDAYIGTTVALNEKFAAVGDFLAEDLYDPESRPKTLIRAIDNGSTKVIDSYGQLSLSGNILAVMRLFSIENAQPAFLEVFRLKERSISKLMATKDFLYYLNN